MPEKSHDAGALFEFDLEHRSDAEIWIRHRGTGHVYHFAISEDRSGLRDEHTIVSNPSSTIDAAMFSTPARRAALRHMATPPSVSENERQLAERESQPVAEAETSTSDEAAVDLDEQASADWMLFPEHPEDGVIYGGVTRVFESVRKAARFIMEELPSHQQKAAHIRTDGGRNYDFDQIGRIYRSTDFKSSTGG
jgi:hypothetical protein